MSTRDKLIQIINEYFFTSEPIDDKSTSEDLGFDSLDQVEIVMAVEEEFNLEIDDEELTGIKTFGDFVALMERKTSPPTP